MADIRKGAYQIWKDRILKVLIFEILLQCDTKLLTMQGPGLLIYFHVEIHHD